MASAIDWDQMAIWDMGKLSLNDVIKIALLLRVPLPPPPKKKDGNPGKLKSGEIINKLIPAWHAFCKSESKKAGIKIIKL